MKVRLKDKVFLNKINENIGILLDSNCGKYFKLNKTGNKVIETLNTEKDITDIIEVMSKSYDIPSKIIEEDIFSFVDKLERNGFICYEGNEPEYNNEVTEDKGIENLWIKVTNKCNLNCPYCYAESNIGCDESHDLSLEEINSIFTEIKPMGLNKIVITGGEPLIRNDIVDIVKLASEYGKVQILTNGTIYNEEVLTELIKYANIIQFSIDSSNKNVHNEVRGENSFEKTLKTVGFLRSIGFENIVFATTPTPTNNVNLKEMVDLCLENRARRLHVNRYIPLGRAANNLKFDINSFYQKADEVYTYVTQLYEEKLRQGLTLDFSVDIAGDFATSVFSHGKKYSCGLANSIVSIDNNGDIYLCQAMHCKELKLGNIRESSVNESMKNAKNNLGCFNVDRTDTCKDCDVRYWCGGGCKALAFAINKNLNTLDPQCCSHRERIIELMGRTRS